MVALAFYKAPGEFYDKVIRFWTGSPYSHVEIVLDQRWFSASPREGHVRFKSIVPKDGHWDFVETNKKIVSPMRDFVGLKYDWTGVFMAQGLGKIGIARSVHERQKFFCSEVCAAVLGHPFPHTLSPGNLYEWIS